MLAAMAAHEVCGAAASTPAPRRGDEGLRDPRMIGEPEVVVAAEGDDLAAVDAHSRSCRRARFDRAPGAVTSLGTRTVECRNEGRVEAVHCPVRAGRRLERAARARARADRTTPHRACGRGWASSAAS